jgi:hypothetical protein
MMQTTWMNPDRFIDGFYGIKTTHHHNDDEPQNKAYNPWDTFRAIYKRMDELAKEIK